MTPDFAVVCWKWQPPRGYRSVFGPQHVNTLKSMVRRNLKMPHRFICVTDDTKGIDADVEIVPMWTDHASVPSPHGAHQPACYRRLKAFSPEIAKSFGPRFVSLDLDTIVTGSLDALFDRPEDFVAWGETDPRSYYNGSMWMMTTGSRRKVWDDFDPKISPGLAYRAGRFGSDQGWISYCLGRGEALWTTQDGVYSYRKHVRFHHLPANAKIVHCHGKNDPWGFECQNLKWVKEHYR